MAIPVLDIPTPKASQRPRPYLRIKALKQWLHNLPKADPVRAARQFSDQLEKLNHSRYALHDRIQLLDALRPAARQLLFGLKQRLRQAEIPLGPRDYTAYTLSQSLLDRMATGYKIVLSELIERNSHKEHDELQLREAIYVVIQYLSRRLVEAYLVYAPEPDQVWHELHQLYRFAEQNGIQQLPLDDPSPDFSLSLSYTIDLAYKRIVLLALAAPYHMMQAEADDIYYLVSAWTGACHLLPATDAPTEGEYALDMASDQPPRFVAEDMPWQGVETRIIDLSEVKQRLDTHLQRILRTSMDTIDHNEQQSLRERRQRDMLLRLAEAWHGSLQRQTLRETTAHQVRMAMGLGASHHYLSNGAPFTPAMDELKMQAEQFEPTLFATAYHLALQKDRFHVSKNFDIRPWWQNNRSETGAALTCNAHCEHTHARVGEVVAYKEDDKPGNHWSIGLIRWLHTQPDKGLNMGLMKLANSAVPVGVKGLRGAGAGMDYSRALLIPKQVSIQQTRSILLPSAIYDVHSALAVNMKQRLFYIKLVSLLRTTNEFSQFTFEILDAPPLEEVEIFVS